MGLSSDHNVRQKIIHFIIVILITGCLFTELGFRVGFRVRISSWIFELDFELGFFGGFFWRDFFGAYFFGEVPIHFEWFYKTYFVSGVARFRC